MVDFKINTQNNFSKMYLNDPGLVIERLRGPVVVVDESGAEALDVGGDARDAVDAVRDAVLLDEARAPHHHIRDWEGSN